MIYLLKMKRPCKSLLVPIPENLKNVEETQFDHHAIVHGLVPSPATAVPALIQSFLYTEVP